MGGDCQFWGWGGTGLGGGGGQGAHVGGAPPIPPMLDNPAWVRLSLNLNLWLETSINDFNSNLSLD